MLLLQMYEATRGRSWPIEAGLPKDSRYNRGKKNGGNDYDDGHKPTTWRRQSRFLLKLLPESILVLFWCFHGGAKNGWGEVMNVRLWPIAKV